MAAYPAIDFGVVQAFDALRKRYCDSVVLKYSGYRWNICFSSFWVIADQKYVQVHVVLKKLLTFG